MEVFALGATSDFHLLSSTYSRQNTALDKARVKPEIPSPTIFKYLEQTDQNNGGLNDRIPPIAECAIHLELLEVFKILQETVIKSNQLDILFDILPQKRYTNIRRYDYTNRRYHNKRKLLTPVKDHDTTFQQRRKAKWDGFVKLAFLRFSFWADRIEEHRWDVFNTGDQLPADLFPPLDILMIWHAFLLKPSLCRVWCRKKQIEWISRVGFPWQIIHSLIDAKDRQLHSPQRNQETFEKLTMMQPNLLEDLVDRGNSLSLSIKLKTSTGDFDDIWSNHDMWMDRMCHALWLRSPAVSFTLREARRRYQQFFDLLASKSDTDLVPTRDVELVWLTHQLSPTSFAEFSQSVAGRIMEHNVHLATDSVAVKEARRVTEEAFAQRYAIAFDRCLCWDCQSLQQLAKKGLSSAQDPQDRVKKILQEVAYYKKLEREFREQR